MQFDGDDYVYVKDSDSLDITRATLEAWIKPGVSTQTGYARIIFKGTNSPFKPLYLLAYDVTGTKMRMGVWIDGVAKIATSTTSLTDTTKWYHILGTYDGSAVGIYVNDVLEASTDVPTDGDIDIGTEALGIGRNTEINAYGYNGIIDDVCIWNVARPPERLNYGMGVDLNFVSYTDPVTAGSTGTITVSVAISPYAGTGTIEENVRQTIKGYVDVHFEFKGKFSWGHWTFSEYVEPNVYLYKIGGPSADLTERNVETITAEVEIPYKTLIEFGCEYFYYYVYVTLAGDPWSGAAWGITTEPTPLTINAPLTVSKDELVAYMSHVKYLVDASGLSDGIRTSLMSKLTWANDLIVAAFQADKPNRLNGAIGQLNAFINELNSNNEASTHPDAPLWINQATFIIGRLKIAIG